MTIDHGDLAYVNAERRRMGRRELGRDEANDILSRKTPPDGMTEMNFLIAYPEDDKADDDSTAKPSGTT
jgi:hypothetical protein